MVYIFYLRGFCGGAGIDEIRLQWNLVVVLLLTQNTYVCARSKARQLIRSDMSEGPGLTQYVSEPWLKS